MKNRHFAIALTAALLAFVSTSCKNFFNGAEVKSQIEDQINYVKSQPYTLFVYSDDETGSFVQGGGSQSLKVTDSFTVEFQVSSAYQFVSWKAVDRHNNSLNRDNYVSFSAETELKTTVTLVNGCEDILIKPYCIPYLSVTEFSPPSKDSGVGFNSDIRITFSDYMDESAFSYTEQELALLDADSVLYAQTFDGREYAYAYEKNSKITYKNIEITSPSFSGSITHFFNAPVIVSGKTLVLSLKDEFFDTLRSNITRSTMEINVSLSRAIESVHSVSFAEDYTNLAFSYNINTEIEASSPYTDVLFSCDSKSGTISPQGHKTVYTGIAYSLDFTASDAWYFKNWDVFYAMNGEPISDGEKIVRFTDPALSKTNFVLTSPISGIMIKPICKKRPVVEKVDFSSSTKISITFSNAMSVDSLRWSYDDISQNSPRVLLRDDNGQIYGYISTANKYVWRNIEIYRPTEQSNVSLLEGFEFPVFENEGRVLTLTRKNPASSGTKVVVRISKAVYDAEGTPCGPDDEWFEFENN